MSEMIEKVARGMSYAQAMLGGFSDPEARDIAYTSTDDWLQWRDHARAAIEAMRECTAGMGHVGGQAWDQSEAASDPELAQAAENVWAAMIDEALR